MSEQNIKTKTISNFLWRFAERSGAQGVSFIVSLVLARMIAPSAYGSIALVTVFTTILQVFVDSGLGNALIQKKDADDIDFSTVFYFNITVCCILYVGVFFAAPAIARFYRDLSLTPVIRVLSLTLIISGVKNVQQAYVSRKLIFRRFFFATLGGTLGAAAVGIFMAKRGYGIWALVAQQIFNAAVDTIILWITVRWRPRRVFSFSRLKGLLSYGSRLLAASLINTVYNEVRQLIIGKVYSSEDLAYYNRGKQFPHFIVQNINSSIDSVLFPVMSGAQEDRSHVRAMAQKSIMTSSYIMWPLMAGLAVTGENLIRVLLTDKWLPALPFLYVFAFVEGMQPIHTSNLNAIKAMGRSDIFLKMEILKKSIGIAMILFTMRISVLAIAVGNVIYTIIASIINSWPNRTLLGYSYAAQIRDILPSFLLAVSMAAFVAVLPVRSLPGAVQLIIQIPAGAAFYLAGSHLLRLRPYLFVRSVLKEAAARFRNR